MDQPAFELFADLAAEATPPPRGILSQTLSDVDGIELVVFAFAAGERLNEHTSSRPAIIHILSGNGTLTLGGRRVDARPGTWVRMPAELRHALIADSPLVMALYLLPPPG